MYYVNDGSATVEEGTYYYYRIQGEDGGWGGGYYSDATFYYLYFPSTRSTSRMPGYGRV